jgi:nicotinamidase-related amidase
MTKMLPLPDLSRAALLVIDVQNAIDAPYHATDGPRNNPDAEKRIACLLNAWRRADRPIIHIRHDSTFPGS